MRIVVFASGSGSNFQVIAEKANELGYEIDCLVCNNPDAFVIERAKKLMIDTIIINHRDFSNREEFEEEVILSLKDREFSLIVLAGFMRLFSERFLSVYEGKIINIHPSLLPKYPGINSIEKAFIDNADEVGVTVFYVDSGVDTGKIIFQEGFINNAKTIEELEERVHKLEHRIYPLVIKDVLEGKL